MNPITPEQLKQAKFLQERFGVTPIRALHLAYVADGEWGIVARITSADPARRDTACDNLEALAVEWAQEKFRDPLLAMEISVADALAGWLDERIATLTRRHKELFNEAVQSEAPSIVPLAPPEPFERWAFRSTSRTEEAASNAEILGMLAEMREGLL